jgi:hypothetical protein
VNKPVYNGATHLSIVWAVTLAILTLLEWRNLDRDPLGREILSPFIQREITVSKARADGPVDSLDSSAKEGEPEGLQYEVEFHFNGPLFLLCFFGPVVVFHGVGQLLVRLRGR